MTVAVATGLPAAAPRPEPEHEECAECGEITTGGSCEGCAVALCDACEETGNGWCRTCNPDEWGAS